MGFDWFELHVRLGTDKAPRWDHSFIEGQLMPLKGKIRKLYVCGAPSMNEVFDRPLETLAAQVDLKWQDIEI